MAVRGLMMMLMGAVLGMAGVSLPHTNSIPASQPRITVISESDNGRQLCLRRGEVLEVRLKTQFGTGYRWELTKPPASRLKLTGQSVESAPPGDESGYETQVFRFEARSTGSFTIRLDHIRPWEKSIDPQKTFSVSGKITKRIAK